jgi:hypothetical protein
MSAFSVPLCPVVDRRRCVAELSSIQAAYEKQPAARQSASLLHRQELNMKSSIALLLVSGLAANAFAQTVRVSAVVPPVRLIRDGQLVAQDLQMGASLNDGDELRSVTAESRVQLDCPHATQTLSESFDAIINAAGAASECAINLKAGTAVASVLSEADTPQASINGGPLGMLATHTQFGLTVPASDPQNVDAFVIEGAVRLTGASSGAGATLAAGQLLNYRSNRVSVLAKSTELSRLAVTYARLDVSRLGSTANPHAETVLTQKWAAVLRSPGDAGVRDALAATHTSLQLSGTQIARYQVARTVQVPLAPPVAPQAPVGVVVKPPPPATQSFANPAQGQYRVDYCLKWGTQCGQPAVDAWCRSKGFKRASTWAPAWDIGAATPTLVIGDKKVCAEAYCDGFASVTCVR